MTVGSSTKGAECCCVAVFLSFRVMQSRKQKLKPLCLCVSTVRSWELMAKGLMAYIMGNCLDALVH